MLLTVAVDYDNYDVYNDDNTCDFSIPCNANNDYDVVDVLNDVI